MGGQRTKIAVKVQAAIEWLSAFPSDHVIRVSVWTKPSLAALGPRVAIKTTPPPAFAAVGGTVDKGVPWRKRGRQAE
jgi:hypothetical protein